MSSRVLGTVVLAGLLAACAGNVESEGAALGTAKSAIINGTASTTADDATVLIRRDGANLCSGVLLNPNLVLTARHCVAPEPSDECGHFAATQDPSRFAIAFGPEVHGTETTNVTKILVEETNNYCTSDIALMLLETSIAGAPSKKVRRTPLKKGEITSTVGYGTVDDNRQLPNVRQVRTNLPVLGVGPAEATFTNEEGSTIPVSLQPTYILLGESTCVGDSGGPLFDKDGMVVGITHAGISASPSCLDNPSVDSALDTHLELIDDALKSAGAKVSTGTPSSTSDDEDDGTTKSSKKKSSSSAAANGGSGCAMTTQDTAPNAGLAALGLALALVVSRRVRRS